MVTLVQRVGPHLPLCPPARRWRRELSRVLRTRPMQARLCAAVYVTVHYYAESQVEMGSRLQVGAEQGG